MGEVRYRLHALQQMVEPGITRGEVRHVLETGDVIERTHQTGRPLPTRLLLGWSGDRHCTSSLRTTETRRTM